MAGGGYIGNFDDSRTGTITGTSGQQNPGITSGGKVPIAVPAITTYQGKTTKDIKVSVDNKNRIIYAELTDTFIKQKGITRVWYDLDPESVNYQWLGYTLPVNDESERLVRVVQVPTISDLNQAISNLEETVTEMIQTLNAKINKKQDQIKFITLNHANETEGQLTPEELELLNSNKCNRLVYSNVIYTYSVRYGHLRRYFSGGPNTTNNLINVDMDTGIYSITSAGNKQVEDHINDTIIHITQAEREKWNNKVSAEAVHIAGTEDYELVLANDNDINI